MKSYHYLLIKLTFVLILPFFSSCSNNQVFPQQKELITVVDYQDGKPISIFDNEGKLISELERTQVYEIEGKFSEGLVAASRVTTNNGIEQYGVGFIDKTGKFIIEPKFSEFSTNTFFSEGLALIGYINPQDHPIGGYTKIGYIDKNGSFVIELPEDAGDCGNFSEGMAYVYLRKLGSYGYIDKSGKFVIPPQFRKAGSFSEGLAYVSIQEEVYKNGYIDKTGTFVIQDPAVSYSDKGFSEGLAIAFKDSKNGYIDKTGKFIIQPQFDEADNFSEGLAAVSLPQDSKYGYIDKTGKFVIQPQFDEANNFSNGLALVKTDEPSKSNNHFGKYGYIDKTGKFVIQPQFLNAWDFSNGLAFVVLEDKIGVIDKTGKFVFMKNINYR